MKLSGSLRRVRIGMSEFMYDIAGEFELDVSTLQTSISPGGVTLEGIKCPAPRTGSVWRRLRSRHEVTGLWPIISHDSPAEWEWESGAQSSPEPVNVGILEEILAAHLKDVEVQFEHLPTSEAEDSDSLVRRVASELTGARTPYREGELIESHFHHLPEWICLTAAHHSHELPLRLHAPSTPNWTGSGVVQRLGYEHHAEVLREWNDRYGVVIYYLGANAIVLNVDRPPVSRSERARVALEQFAY